MSPGYGGVLLVAAPLFLAAPVRAAVLPECAGPVEIASAQIERVEKNGVLILRDGRAAHLEGVRLPAGARDHAPQFIADQALAALSDFTVGHRLNLAALPPKEDRYDRVRSQIFDGRSWIQLELLKRGLARVSIAPDRIECASEFYSAEAQARAAHAGLWSSSAYAIRSTGHLAGDLGTFQIVEGRVLSATVRDGQAWLYFDTGPGGHFAATITSEDLRTYRLMGVDPRGYAGRLLRVRGVVQNLGGLAIAIANPIQVEVIQ